MDFWWYSPVNPINSSCTQFNSDITFCELFTPLLKDSVYCITMQIFPPALLELNSIQVYFASTINKNLDRLIKSAHRVDLLRTDGKPIVDNVTSIRKKQRNEIGTYYGKWIVEHENEWVEVKSYYRANGDEKYFIIGNITTDNYIVYSGMIHKRKLQVQKSNNPCLVPFPEQALRYFVDEVEVVLMGGGASK
jgi:hypothetical protein